jgi:hypothetical protein
MPDALVYNRTLAEAVKCRNGLSHTNGAWNYTDLNRVEDWCDYLADILTDMAYPCDYSAFSGGTWAIDDFPDITELDRMRDNVECIAIIAVDGYTLVDPFEIADDDNEYPIDYTFPNSLEYNLYLADLVIAAIIEEYELTKKLGVHEMGSDGVLI